MAQIKNLHLLGDVDRKDLSKMEHAASEHAMISNITFKIVELLPSKVVIQAVQGKSPNGNQFTQKRLIEIARETFSRFFEGKRIDVHAIPYKAPPANVVTPEWIRHHMTETGTRLKDIADETGVDNTYLSTVINGRNELSQQMKAMLYYYFLSKKGNPVSAK